eukprot:CAMPEP_0178459952 /NCGR_PEP_ID=MMETSP0689_2-20121128/48417_1 /TAXON_ID=160604 /ORGANISM="Amphidinium massartii, Strain CS-259" /LENGTH=39 /DNA_ID= /DNA_START= /DNA_END= /DNA_ORIENTATION=
MSSSVCATTCTTTAKPPSTGVKAQAENSPGEPMTTAAQW